MKKHTKEKTNFSSKIQMGYEEFINKVYSDTFKQKEGRK